MWKMDCVFHVLDLEIVLTENIQNNILLFWIFFTNFFLVFENTFLKMTK